MMPPELHRFSAREWDALGPMQRAILAKHRRRTVTELGMAHNRRYHGPDNRETLQAELEDQRRALLKAARDAAS